MSDVASSPDALERVIATSTLKRYETYPDSVGGSDRVAGFELPDESLDLAAPASAVDFGGVFVSPAQLRQ